MPLYEYRCNLCGAEFEKMLRFSEADQLPECPHCHSAQTQKRLSRVVSFGAAPVSAGNASGAGCGSSGGFS